MIRKIDHINIVTKDLNKSIQFYTDILGFTETGRKQLSGKWIESLTGIKDINAEVAFMKHGEFETKLEILSYKKPQGLYFKENSIPNTFGLRHIAFTTDNFEIMVEKLKKHNVQLVGQPQNIPNPTEKYKSKICYFLDPDNVLIEITG